VVDADLASYFDTIPRKRLMERVEERISDGRLLKLLDGALDAEAGTPQARFGGRGGR